MSPRLPESKDFPSYLELSITQPPSSQAPVNVLILLHGLGDTKASFTNLARQLALPETTCIALQAPTPLPFDLGGFHWGDDIIFDQTTGSMDFDTGFVKSSKVVAEDVLQKGLIEKCGYGERDVFFLGFGQGGMVALTVAAASLAELGGVISIGGPLPSSSSDSGRSKPKTPVLIIGGSSKSLITTATLTNIKNVFQSVETEQWARPGDVMPRNRQEMLPIMQFLARRLRSRHGVPEGSIEVG